MDLSSPTASAQTAVGNPAGPGAAGDRRREPDLVATRVEFDELLLSVVPQPNGETNSIYRRLARLVGRHIRASFCHVFVGDALGNLTLQMSAGPRPSAVPSRRRLALADLAPWHAELARGESVAIGLDGPDRKLVRSGVFSRGAKGGYLVPFTAGSGRRGLLVVAEQRSGVPPDLKHFEFIARRLGAILERERVIHLRQVEVTRRQRSQAVLAERRRLSRELHDAVGQSLSTLLIQIRLAASRGVAASSELELLENITQQAIDQARALVYDLRQEEIDPIGEARRMAERILTQRGCLLEWIDNRPSQDVRVEVLRQVAAAIRESVTNIVRHAGATRATVQLAATGDRLRVTIVDDGVGFTPEAIRLTRDGRGLGLKGMAERLEAVGGVATVMSAPALGTTIVLEVGTASLRRSAKANGERTVVSDIGDATIGAVAGALT